MREGDNPAVSTILPFFLFCIRKGAQVFFKASENRHMGILADDSHEPPQPCEINKKKKRTVVSHMNHSCETQQKRDRIKAE